MDAAPVRKVSYRKSRPPPPVGDAPPLGLGAVGGHLGKLGEVVGRHLQLIHWSVPQVLQAQANRSC